MHIGSVTRVTDFHSLVAMVKGKFGKADFSLSNRFQVKYLGYEVTEEPGVTGIEKAVRKIHEKVESEERYCPKMFLLVDANGVKLEEAKPKTQSSRQSKLISLENISYCALNRNYSTVFAFNHHKSPSMVECHAVACENEDKAKSISLALYAAFREGHFQKLRGERRISLEQKKIERRASFEKNDVARSNDSSSATSPTEVSSPDLRDHTSAISLNATRDRRSPHESLLSEECADDQELELGKIIEELLSIVEIEKAKISQEVE